MSTLRVLHLDDEQSHLDRVRLELERAATERPFSVSSVADLAAFRQELERQPPDIAVIDMHIDPGAEQQGVEAARLCRQMSPETVVIFHSFDLSSLRRAMAVGADDFIMKSMRGGELGNRVYSTYMLVKAKSPMAGQTAGRFKPIGPSMLAVQSRMARIVDSAIRAVYVHGESGTGKEVVVQCLEGYQRPGTPVVKVNCGAIAPHLIESELFGYKKGAFTGALQDKVGLLEAAAGGWIFLDEVVNLSFAAQTALLRVLESRELIRVGDHAVRTLDIKVISASNIDLSQAVKDGKFRVDLWQRLQEARIELLPLRQRQEEIPLFVAHFCATEAGGPYRIADEAMAVLSDHPWKHGNIRELRNCIRAMTERHVDRLLTPLSVPAWVLGPLDAAGGGTAAVPASDDPDRLWLPYARSEAAGLTFDLMADRLLLAMIRKSIARDGPGSARAIAQRLGLPKTSLTRKLKQFAAAKLLDEAEAAVWFQDP